MKKIVFVNQSSGYLLTDVLNVYAKEYDEVALIYGTIKENERKLDARIKLDKICAYDRSSAIGRIKTWAKATWQIYRKLKRDYKDYEIVYVTNPPMAYLCSLRLKNPFSVIVFDTYPDALSNIGIRKGNPLFNMWAGWNRKLFLKAKKVFTLSEGMAERLGSYMDRNKITVVPCWSANSTFAPMAKEENLFVKEHGLKGKFVVMYSGNMGVTHNVQLLVECAKRLKEVTGIHFMLIGGGTKKSELEATVKAEGLPNCTFLDWLPAEQLPYSLAAADLGVISLTDETALVSVPSKTFNLLAVGCPLMCIVPQRSEIARMVDKYENSKCFEVNEVNRMVDYIRLLSSNKAEQIRLSKNSLVAATDFTVENAKSYLMV